MIQECDVAIVGAGPTGLTLANLLGQAGLDVILVERNSSTVQEPRAVSIDDESLRTMQATGLLDSVLQDVALDYGSHYFTRDGRCFAKVEPATREYGFPRRNAFTQPKLEAALRRGLDRFPNVVTLFGHSCETVAEDGSGVSLSLRSGSGGGIAIRARYLAACDGASSALRKVVGAALCGSTYRQRWLIVDLASTHEQLRQTRVVCDPDRPLITLPGPDGIRRYEFMLRDGEDEERAAHPDHVRALLEAHGPDADARIVRRQVYAFHARIADRWNTQRIFLAGDAAHLSPPFAGQGMNSGVRDAHNLAWKLAEVISGRLGPELLTTYQRERAPHAWALIQLAIKMGRVMMPTSRRQAAMIQLGFRLAQLAPGIHAHFTQMKYKPKPFYEKGFVVPDDGGMRLAGRMLPQPLLQMTDRRYQRLDDVMGGQFALVAYGPDAQHMAATTEDFGLHSLRRVAVLPTTFNPAQDCPDVSAGRDTDGHMSSLSPAGRNVLMLVRPDRYVAAAAFAEGSSIARMARAMRDLAGQTWSATASATGPIPAEPEASIR
ncbi:bifunctional 3-(3-hydroxy-phenyl)propionate/3-hydroxycinnamic acid hydroxylase [Bosea sp. BIWAKO-01]|uniref:bifunctional 3-(3-hydroxy-phenyl)propionate/3-hydroxycinnamic acid hydroxylase n=1 Tax=Bosea sp. BIWAKO-01 TaxID=506668 RepID=UPI000853A2E7|nr:bifunctional 3-(3-hydroxy-phenyl)propionate/3-hydroxycinnamic acid hydroxylase [Bosea sp. BIWAKO-01]GAU83870.1 3-3-hydroxy-phenyl propionate hydroxylase [Bosea sp. BIWAKO-01]